MFSRREMEGRELIWPGRKFDKVSFLMSGRIEC